MSTLHNLLEREYGVSTTVEVNPVTGLVGVTPVRVLNNNPGRVSWTIINLGTGWVTLALDYEVSATRGIYLASGGGGVNWVWREEFEAVGWEIYAVAQNAATPIYVLETVITP